MTDQLIVLADGTGLVHKQESRTQYTSKYYSCRPDEFENTICKCILHGIQSNTLNQYNLDNPVHYLPKPTTRSTEHSRETNMKHAIEMTAAAKSRRRSLQASEFMHARNARTHAWLPRNIIFNTHKLLLPSSTGTRKPRLVSDESLVLEYCLGTFTY